MRISDHLTAQTPTLELRGFRLWDLSQGQLDAKTIPADPEGDIENPGGTLGANHTGLTARHPTLGPVWWKGTDWESFSRQSVFSGEYPHFDLGVAASGKGRLITGQANGRALPVDRDAIPLSDFGAATAAVSMGGFRISNAGSPEQPGDLATRAYVDAAASGVNNVKDPVELSTDRALPSCVYNAANGTLTATANGALTPSLVDAAPGAATLMAGAEGVGTRILVRHQASTIQAGIYRVSSLGSGSTQWVLVRTVDANENPKLVNAQVRALGGSFAGTVFRQTRGLAEFDISAGTGALTWVDWIQAPVYSDGFGLSLSGSVFSLRTYDASGGNMLVGGEADSECRVLLMRGSEVRRSGIANSTNVGLKQVLMGQSGTALTGVPIWSPFALATPPNSTATEQRYLAQVVVPASGWNWNAPPRYEPLNPPNNSLFYSVEVGGSDQLSAGNNIPFSFTMQGQAILTAASIIPINRGGLGKDNASAPTGSVAFKDAAGTVGFTATTPAVEMMPMVVSSGVVDLVNIFARANTWTNSNTFQDAAGNSPDRVVHRSTVLPGTGATNGSPVERFEGKTNSAGTVSYHHYGHRVMGRDWEVLQSIDQATGAPGAWTTAMALRGATKRLEILAGQSGTALQLGLLTIVPDAEAFTAYVANNGRSSGILAFSDMPNYWSVTQESVSVAGTAGYAVAHTADGSGIFRAVLDAAGVAGGRLQMGPGGAAALDWTLERSAPGVARIVGRLQMAAGGVSNGIDLASGVHVVGSGLWRAGLVEMAYGGLQANVSGWTNGNLAVKGASGFTQAGGTPAAGKLPRHTGSGVSWSSFTIPDTFAIGDLAVATSANALTALARPGTGTDTHVLGLASGLPSWRSAAAVRGSGSTGTGAQTGWSRVWKTLYQGTNPADRFVNFTHPLGTRSIHHVNVRRTNSGDTLSPSPNVVTGWSVIDASTVRVFFAAPPQSAEYYEVSFSA